jgi:hypothetical protein
MGPFEKGRPAEGEVFAEGLSCGRGRLEGANRNRLIKMNPTGKKRQG